MNRRGSVLLVVLVALLGAGLALATFHHTALVQLRLARSSLAASRAREAAAAGLVHAHAGLGPTGLLPGGASWAIVVDSVAPGLQMVWSTGQATRPQPARLEVGAMRIVPDSATGAPPSLSGWTVLRHE